MKFFTSSWFNSSFKISSNLKSAWTVAILQILSSPSESSVGITAVAGMATSTLIRNYSLFTFLWLLKSVLNYVKIWNLRGYQYSCTYQEEITERVSNNLRFLDCLWPAPYSIAKMNVLFIWTSDRSGAGHAQSKIVWYPLRDPYKETIYSSTFGNRWISDWNQN